MRIPFRITICGIDELGGHCAAGVSHVLSILDPGWEVPPAFGTYGEHERLELRFHDIIDPQPGMELPEAGHVRRLLAFGADLAAEPTAEAHLLVHCHAGVSRSSASMALMLAQALSARSGDEIMQEIARIRPVAWPNLRIVELGDALLGRGGELIAGAHALYRQRLEARPDLAEAMSLGGRRREVEAAAAIRPGAVAPGGRRSPAAG